MAVETLDLRGVLVERCHTPVPVPTTRAALDPVLLAATERVVSTAPGPVLAATLSVAGPVDRTTGRLVHLPDSPFLVDDLDPVPLLQPLLGLEPAVDNDVDWAALAEREVGSARGLDEFVYVFLGPGLGGAVVTGGRIAHGGRGLAGEIAHLLTVGARGRAVRLIEAFVELGLRRADSLALDLDLVRSALDGRTAADRRTRDRILSSLAAAIGSIAALLDPAAVDRRWALERSPGPCRPATDRRGGDDRRADRGAVRRPRPRRAASGRPAGRRPRRARGADRAGLNRFTTLIAAVGGWLECGLQPLPGRPREDHAVRTVAGRAPSPVPDPPPQARPMMRWWWFGPEVSRADIERDLTSMADAGIGGVEVAYVYPLVEHPTRLGRTSSWPIWRMRPTSPSGSACGSTSRWAAAGPSAVRTSAPSTRPASCAGNAVRSVRPR